MGNIGSIIKKYRTKSGLTQDELGKKLFTSKQTVSKWENGISLPNIETLRKLGNLLNIPNAEIMQEHNEFCNERIDSNIRPTGTNRQKNGAEIEQWRDLKFGMFIHYGIYSMIGGKSAEWGMFSDAIDIDEYAEIAKDFTAEGFSGEYYARLAKKAGMKYMVMTTRHHDGFCLFDSKHSHKNFTVMHTKCKRDIIREYTEACRKNGLSVGLYYSPMDWRFEGFFFPKMYNKSALAMREQAYAQIEELIENYGKIDIMWYDGGEDFWLAHSVNLNTLNPVRDDTLPTNYRNNPPIPEFWGEYELDKKVRTKHPHIVINNRLGLRRLGDYITPERVVGGFDPIHPWETCDTLSETWGWTPKRSPLPFERIIHLLVEVVTGGGNLLLNVSPKGDGTLEAEHEARLLEVGAWMEKFGRFIHGTRGGPIKNSKEFGGFTHKGNSLYVFLKAGASNTVKIPLLSGKIKNIYSHTQDTLKTEIHKETLRLNFENRGNDPVSIAEIEFDRPISVIFENFEYDRFDAFDSSRG